MAKKKELANNEQNDSFKELDEIIKSQFDEIIDLSKVDSGVKNWYDTGIYALNYTMSKSLRHGIPAGRITSYTGLSGCLFENTKIKIKRENESNNEYTIKEIFEKVKSGKWDNTIPIYTFSYQDDKDGIYFNEIKEVIDSGNKECFELVTGTGKSIIVSEEHPFLTKEKDERGIKEKDGFVQLKDLRIGEEIMIFEADQNVPLGDKYHWEKILSIKPVGVKHTYDIRMKEPYSNFVANDFVVHNTGKSLLAASAMKDPNLDMIIVIETEGGGHAKELIDFAGVDPAKVRILKANTFSCYRISKSNSKIEEIPDDKFPAKKDTPEYYYVEGAKRMIKRLVNVLEFNSKLRESKILMILDSLGNLQSVRELSGGFDMGKRAQDIGAFFRTFDVAFEKTNIAFLYTNKLYTNLGNQWDPFKETGGVNVEYNPSLSVRFTESSITDDVSDSELSKEKERRKTSLGSSIKSIRATVTKSRFGTELRNAWFLLDMVTGPVRFSGLFTLLHDFGIIKGNRMYSIDGWNEGKQFYKKDFISIVEKNEQENIDFFQKKLEEAENEIKQKKLNLKVNDISEIPDEDDLIEPDENDVIASYNTDDNMSSMLMNMEKDI